MTPSPSLTSSRDDADPGAPTGEERKRRKRRKQHKWGRKEMIVPWSLSPEMLVVPAVCTEKACWENGLMLGGTEMGGGHYIQKRAERRTGAAGPVWLFLHLQKEWL